MAAAMIQVVKVHQDQEGRLLAHFKRVDSLTKRPAGEVFVSSPITGIEVVNDSNGGIHQGDEACMIIRTQTGSVYFAVLDKSVANTIAQTLVKGAA